MPRSEDSTGVHRVIGGRYRLETTIGHGAMGHVWAGTDELLHRPVAVKEIRLSPGIPDEEAAELRERALREARSMAVLSHPNAVLLYDVAREGDQPFVVMELVHAPSLSTVLSKHGALTPPQLAVLIDGVAAALQAAHEVGIVHRDVKPGNVLLGRDRQVKLADFGISRNVAEATLTRSGALVGTPAYLAPEIAVGGQVGPSADLWSLGATVFAAAEGRLPYEGTGDPLITVSSIVHGPVPPHRQSGPIGEVISGLMVKDPAQRMPLLEVRRRVQGLARSAGESPFDALLDGLESAPIRPPTPPWAVTAADAPATVPQGKRTTHRAKIVLSGVAVVAVAAAATGGFVAGRIERPGTTPTTQEQPGTIWNPYLPLEAESAAVTSGSIPTGTDTLDGRHIEFLGPITHGDSIVFPVDFGPWGANQVTARFRTWVPDGKKAKIELRLDSPTGEVVGKIRVSAFDGQHWKSVPVDLQRSLTGKHDVYLSFAADQREDFMHFDWIQFHQ